MSGTISASLDRLRLFAPTFCTLLLAVVLWVLNHPYVGFFYGDAGIYSLLALHWLDPTAYARDPFFMFGSQDDYSVFSTIYGSLVQLCGLSLAAQIVMVVAAMLWIAAAWLLALRVFDDWRARAFVVLALAIWSFNYSPDHATYVLNENFTTARAIAIPLSVMAIAFSLERKWMLAVVFALLSMLVHPLFGIWGVVVMAGVSLADRALFGLLVAILAAILLASLLPEPGVLHLMDTHWIETVRQSTKDVVVGPYGSLRLNATLFWISALLLGGRFGSSHMRRWYEVTALATCYGFLLAQLCSYFYPIQLVLQAQAWRGMWLAIYLGMFALVDVGRILLCGEKHLRLAGVVVAVILFICMKQSAALLLTAWLLLRGNLLDIISTSWRKACQSYARYIAGLAIGLVLTVAPTYWRELAIEGNSLIITWLPNVAVLKGVLIVGGLGLGPLVWCGVMALPVPRIVMTVLLMPALVAAGMNWDHRVGGALRWESRVSGHGRFPVLKSPVRRGDVVLWPGNSQRVLFELGTASYASSFQAIGIVLSQRKTDELAVRLKRMSIASLADAWPLTDARQAELLKAYEGRINMFPDSVKGNLHDYEPAQMTGFGLRYVCEDPALDWVVSGSPISSAPVIPIVVVDEFSHGHAYFYRCITIPRSAG